MQNVDCSACTSLQDNAATFVQNGVTTAVCTSLKNNTGFSTSNDNTNCEDLDDANDCLVGMMEAELASYDLCDWKEFMKNFIPNLHQVIKAMICSECGQWTAIERNTCMVDYMMQGASFSFGEKTEDKDSYIVPGTGVDFSLRSSSDEHSTDVTIQYIAGGLCRITGSLTTFIESFADADKKTQEGNTVWNFTSDSFELPDGGELLYEIRIKRSEYPQIKRLFNGHIDSTSGKNRNSVCTVLYFDEGAFAYGQHGWCDSDGTPTETGYSKGHEVPEGWFYVQVRMCYVDDLRVSNQTDGNKDTKRGTEFTPRGYTGIRMNQDEIEC